MANITAPIAMATRKYPVKYPAAARSLPISPTGQFSRLVRARYNLSMNVRWPAIAVGVLVTFYGCSPPATSTLQSEYQRLFAEYDREVDKGQRLTAAIGPATDNSAAEHYHSVFGRTPTEKGMQEIREQRTTDRYPNAIAFSKAYEALPEVVAARQHHKLVQALKDEVEQARQAWIDAEGSMPASELKRKQQLQSMRQKKRRHSTPPISDRHAADHEQREGRRLGHGE
jgi:hypothetical protein